MNERDFNINGVDYQCNKMNAMDQFHIVRRMAPLLGELLPVINELSKAKKADDQMDDAERMDAIVKFASPLMTGLSKLSDEDANKVLLGLLSTVSKKETSAGGFAKISDGKILLFQNLDLPTMFQIAGRAFMFNLSGFFAALPQASPGGK